VLGVSFRPPAASVVRLVQHAPVNGLARLLSPVVPRTDSRKRGAVSAVLSHPPECRTVKEPSLTTQSSLRTCVSRIMSLGGCRVEQRTCVRCGTSATGPCRLHQREGRTLAPQHLQPGKNWPYFLRSTQSTQLLRTTPDCRTLPPARSHAKNAVLVDASLFHRLQLVPRRLVWLPEVRTRRTRCAFPPPASAAQAPATASLYARTGAAPRFLRLDGLSRCSDDDRLA